MTRDEALAYLGEEWQDSFEEEIFLLKQQLISLVPINKLYQSKLKKWEKLEEAFRVLGGTIEYQHFSLITIPVFFNDILNSFTLYQENRNDFKLKLLNTTNLSDAKIILDAFIELESLYASLWLDEEVDENIIVSNIPDPMEILNAIKSLENLRCKTFDDLKEMIKAVPEILIREQKRLTLYYTKYGKNE
jgi:hypothetical protein